MGRNDAQNNAEVACLMVVRYFVSTQRHSLMEIPLHRGREAGTASHLEAAACFTALADLGAHHHPASASLMEVLLQRGKLHPFHGKNRLLSSPGSGAFGWECSG